MPTEHPDLFLIENREDLEREIEALSQMVRDSSGSESNNGGSTAVLRIFSDMDPDTWIKAAERHGLQDWLALPLDSREYPLLTRLQGIIEDLAYKGEHDPMTGLLNRRAFELRVSSEIERAKRNRRPVTLALIDLDDFKAVNDEYGHPVGDDVLMAVARTLVGITRRYDVPGRIGGEEFALFLPDTGMVKAKATVARILESVRELEFTTPEGQPFKVTCSVGVVCWKARSMRNPPDLYDIADRALYEAKKSGKDRMEAELVSDRPDKQPDSLVKSAEKRFLFTGS
jgi:diguanylate cyclase (GGDEF)-like protein